MDEPTQRPRFLDEPTQRPRFLHAMPPALLAQVEDYAKRYSLSRNAAINYLCTYALETFNDATGPRHTNERRSR